MSLRPVSRRGANDPLLYALLACLLLLVFVGGLGIGRFRVSPKEALRICASRVLPLEQTWSRQAENVVMKIRLPRVCGAALVGCALAVSGAAYQGVFRNPLVSPGLLGVSSGACVGAALAILLHLSTFWIQLSALGCGLLAVVLSMSIPALFTEKSAPMLVLSGVIVSGFMSSILGLLKYAADPENELASIVYWTMGSLASVEMRDVRGMGVGIAAAAMALVLVRWRINLLALGDTEARALGVNVRRLRGFVIFCATLATAGAVCMSGTIGWVGLVVPHLGRLVAGTDNKRLIPVCAFLGAAFAIAVDTCARSLTASEIPLSILTGMIGTPLFIWLLLVQRARR